MRSTRSEAAMPPPGLRVGHYQLLAKIGEGGMGVVHLAQAPDGSRVALKVLRPHIIGDDEARERLAREVASLQRVRSPRIAEVIDADPWGETPFVATRYVPGLSLHEHLKEEGPLRGEDLHFFAAGLAEAVLAVHSVGVLHRDIKPSNVLLEGRAPVLIDFGLARLADDPRLTVTGWLLGTPGYLAPEILYGDDATTASDVHSWGATVAFAVTGHPPFGRGPAMAIMDRVRRGEHDLSEVPADIKPMILAALDPDPAARPSLPALLADLRPPHRQGPRWGHQPVDEATMPFALATSRHDDDPTDAFGDPDDPTDVFGASEGSTDVLSADGHAARLDEARTLAETVVDGRFAQPVAAPPTTPLTQVHQAARAPYMEPAPPAQTVPPQSQEARQAPEPPQPPPNSAAPLQRALFLTGLFALVTLGFALAPYLSVVVVGLGALAVRTWSWTSQAARERAWRRGPKWYDGPLAVLTAPWYLLVATGGTLMLVLWSAALAFVVGLGLLLFRAPLESGLLGMGAVLALSMWWGPGGRRVRRPTRSLMQSTTRRAWLGWSSVAAVAVAGAFMAYLWLNSGVNWAPMPGPPWRQGTLLGDLANWL